MKVIAFRRPLFLAAQLELPRSGSQGGGWGGGVCHHPPGNLLLGTKVHIPHGGEHRIVRLQSFRIPHVETLLISVTDHIHIG